MDYIFGLLNWFIYITFVNIGILLLAIWSFGLCSGFWGYESGWTVYYDIILHKALILKFSFKLKKTHKNQITIKGQCSMWVIIIWSIWKCMSALVICVVGSAYIIDWVQSLSRLNNLFWEDKYIMHNKQSMHICMHACITSTGIFYVTMNISYDWCLPMLHWIYIAPFFFLFFLYFS